MTRDKHRWRLGEIARAITRLETPAPDDPRPYLGLEHLAQGEPRILGQARAGDARSAKAVFACGDVLLGKLRPNLRKAVLAPFDGVCSTDILVLRAGARIVPGYLLAVLHTESFWSFAVSTAAGTRMPRTSWSSLAEHRVALPDLATQRRVAEALAAVDLAVRRNEEHLAHLRATRRALAERLLGED